ncbi:MAG: ArsR/SmtB family transcription factor [Rhodospirillales bacterium]
MHPGTDVEPVTGNVKRASQLLKAMGNRHRLMVLCQLLSGERSVGELEKIIGLSQSALSQHLARLRREALVKTRRQAQTIFYSLDGNAAIRIIGALKAIFAGGDAAVPVGPLDGNEHGNEHKNKDEDAAGSKDEDGPLGHAVCG